LGAYTTGVSGLGIVLLAWSLSRIPSFPPDVPLFIGLVIAAELTVIEAIVPQVVFSISAPIAFAALLLLGPLPAALIGMVGGLANTLIKDIMNRRHQKSSSVALTRRVLFNMAAFGLAILVAGRLYFLCGGEIVEVAVLPNLLPLVLAAISFELINAGLVVAAVSLQTSQPAIQVWRQNMSWAKPMNLLSMVMGGAGLAFAYQVTGLLGLGIFFMPLALTIYAYRLYVEQTKLQMARLDEIVAEGVKTREGSNQEIGP
jgi:hypothetical protein